MPALVQAEASARSSPRRRPANSAVAHGARSLSSTASSRLASSGDATRVTCPADGGQFGAGRRVDRDIGFRQSAAVDRAQRQQRVADRRGAVAHGHPPVDQCLDVAALDVGQAAGAEIRKDPQARRGPRSSGQRSACRRRPTGCARRRSPPPRHASAASRSVGWPARSVPRRRPACASTRHAFASPRLGKLFSRRPSRTLQTTARQLGVQEHRPPPALRHPRRCRTSIRPGSASRPSRPSTPTSRCRGCDPRRLRANIALWGSCGEVPAASDGFRRAPAERPQRRRSPATAQELPGYTRKASSRGGEGIEPSKPGVAGPCRF